jgi:uncharacterized RDD family membrane protein YckC
MLLSMQLSYQKVKSREHVADMGTRVLAFCVDSLLLLMVISIIEYFTVSSDESAWLFKGERLLHFLMGWLYFAGSESSIWQASIGKHVLGLRVASLEGQRISFKCASLRYVIKPISLFVVLMRALSGNPISSHSLLFHDKIASTQVVKE